MSDGTCRNYFLIVGGAAFLAIAFPPLIFLGLVLGIVPGIFLAAAPSLFAYSLLWRCVRDALAKLAARAGVGNSPETRRARRFVLTILSSTIVIAPAVLIPSALGARLDEESASLRKDDLEPSVPVLLPETVAIIMDRSSYLRGRRPHCDTLCLRLLYNKAATRIIVQNPAYRDAVASFAIEQREQCPETRNFWIHVAWKRDPSLPHGQSFEDRIQARMKRGECLTETVGNLRDAEATISYRVLDKGTNVLERSWTMQAKPTATRLEITGPGNVLLYRRTEVTALRVATPLLVVAAGGPMTTVTYFGWLRRETTDAPLGPQGRDVLPLVLGAAVHLPDEPES